VIPQQINNQLHGQHGLARAGFAQHDQPPPVQTAVILGDLGEAAVLLPAVGAPPHRQRLTEPDIRRSWIPRRTQQLRQGHSLPTCDQIRQIPRSNPRPCQPVTRTNNGDHRNQQAHHRLLSMSRSVIYEQMRAGRLKFVKLGRATLIPAAAITEYVEMLLSESGVCLD
jgi:excisionase family DNA binding protein